LLRWGDRASLGAATAGVCSRLGRERPLRATDRGDAGTGGDSGGGDGKAALFFFFFFFFLEVPPSKGRRVTP